MTDREQMLPASEKDRAIQIQTEAYLKAGFITPNQLQDGVFLDEYSDRSDYIVSKNPHKETAMRVINTDKEAGGLFSLPTLKHFDIDPVRFRDAAQVTRLSHLAERKVVEISGLASIAADKNRPVGSALSETMRTLDATRQAYSAALRHSLERGHELWVMNIDDKLLTFLDTVLGEDSYQVVGDRQEYVGPPTVPVVMRPHDVVEGILHADDDSSKFARKNKKDLQAAFQGISEENLTLGMTKLLHSNDIDTSNEHQWRTGFNRLMRNKKTAFYSFIVGYSAIRAAGVGAVDEFDGSIPGFLALDVGTAVTQVGSMELFFKGKNRTTRSLGALGTAASFAAPYAYFFWAGNEEYPPYVNAVAGGMVALAAGLETKSALTDKARRDGLAFTDLEQAD